MSNIDTRHIDLLSLVGTKLKKASRQNGGVYHGICPFCGGDDRFHVWVNPPEGNPRMWCRQCGFSGDAIGYVMRRDGSDFKTACDTLGITLEKKPASFTYRAPAAGHRAPATAAANFNGKDWVGITDKHWQKAAEQFVYKCFSSMTAEGQRYLSNRGLDSDIVTRHLIGYNPHPQKAQWGPLQVWLPAGVVIPWIIDGVIWRVNIRRLDGSEPKYIQPAGCANGLFNADFLKPGCTAVLCEGEFDAMAIEQRLKHKPDIVPVATGSVTGSRIYRWIGKLALCSSVFVAFDADEPGDKESDFWLDVFPRAFRCRPLRHDVSDMLVAGDDIESWLLS